MCLATHGRVVPSHIRKGDMDGYVKAVCEGIAAAKAPQIVAAVPAAATADMPEQTRKLGDLRDQGLITDDEFEAMKQGLLARM